MTKWTEKREASHSTGHPRQRNFNRLYPVLAMLLIATGCFNPGAWSAGSEVPQPRDPSLDPSDAMTESGSYLSRIEQGEYIADCMTDHGFIGEVDPISGGVEIDFGDPAQESVMHEAFLECIERLQDIFGPVPEETPEYLSDLYRMLLWTHQCLIDHGYPATDPPTLEVFLDGGDDRWHPYEFRDRDSSISETEFYHIEDVCPSDPTFLMEYLDIDGS